MTRSAYTKLVMQQSSSDNKGLVQLTAIQRPPDHLKALTTSLAIVFMLPSIDKKDRHVTETEAYLRSKPRPRLCPTTTLACRRTGPPPSCFTVCGSLGRQAPVRQSVRSTRTEHATLFSTAKVVRSACEQSKGVWYGSAMWVGLCS